jgi:hypothetical protein
MIGGFYSGKFANGCENFVFVVLECGGFILNRSGRMKQELHNGILPIVDNMWTYIVLPGLQTRKGS